MNVKEYRNIIDTKKKVFVFFTGKFCKPCKTLYPKYDEFVDKNLKDVKLLKIDVDKSEELSDWLKIKSLPTILVYLNGECVDILESADLDKFKEMYKTLLRS
jgi:thioredoxin-like negative regulator of GroEL